MNEVVSIEHVGMKYQAENGEIEAIRDISLNVKEGEFVCLIGPSGSGKSTLLSAIAGLEPITRGRIAVKGVPVSGTSKTVGYMLQKDHLFDWRSIWGNITLGLEVQKNGTPETLGYARDLLRQYGLSDFAQKYPSQLSGGMRQRCALIRTLACRPEILLLDEPFSALDYQTRLALADEIHGILKREKKTAIIVTHDISEGISLSDKIVLLSKRPAVVKKVYDITSLSALTPMQRRDHPEFGRYFNEIWRELDVHVS